MSENETQKKGKKQNRVKAPEGTISPKMIPTELPNGLKTETKVFAVTYPGYRDLLEEAETEVLSRSEADEWVVEQRKRWRAARRFDLARHDVRGTVKSLYDKMGKIPTGLLTDAEEALIADARDLMTTVGNSIVDPEISKAVFLGWIQNGRPGDADSRD